MSRAIAPPLRWEWKALPLVHHVRARIRARHIVELVPATVTIVVAILVLNVPSGKRIAGRIPRKLLARSIEQYGVRHPAPRSAVAVCGRSLPNDLVAKIAAENPVENDFKIMRGGRVAVQIQGSVRA